MNMGIIEKIAGPLVVARDMSDSNMYDVVKVGDARLVGEIIQLRGEKAVIQVYEDTTGVKPGEPVATTAAPLSVSLGPGVLGQIYDGIQRPLEILQKKSGAFIARGISADPIAMDKKWKFVATAKKGEIVHEGSIIGYVQETEYVKHYIMIPKGIRGKIKSIGSGTFNLKEGVAVIEDKSKEIKVTMMQDRPVRNASRFAKKFRSEEPLITGQRIIDTFFPIAKGGSAAVPGPFGAGKTVIQHQLAKYTDADIVVYVGCGERGNEMTEILTEFPELKDPKTGRPLIERTVLIANTSNMPVAAREASIYTGITIAEYFRDMGYNVAIMADSTSRWAEAMREISARLEEMPGEEGYPAYLSKRLAEYYERSGKIESLGGKIGSVTIIGAVSPPGGDISEPVSQGTLRVVKAFWSLDASLANARHFPSINWLNSYSLYLDALDPWYKKNIGEKYIENRQEAMRLLQREAELKDIVQLVGEDALPDSEKVVLDIGRMLREDYLRQSAFDEIDAYTSFTKQGLILGSILHFSKRAGEAVSKGVSSQRVSTIKARAEISRMKTIPEKEIESHSKKINEEIDKEVNALIREEEGEVSEAKAEEKVSK
ncbi:V-type ATP synthase subunit A [Candidatus Marsarchaeota archaeon]|nr:V-type ATP synthase subunit A [Candidatus Marsarchaeota archaeon]